MVKRSPENDEQVKRAEEAVQPFVNLFYTKYAKGKRNEVLRPVAEATVYEIMLIII